MDPITGSGTIRFYRSASDLYFASAITLTIASSGVIDEGKIVGDDATSSYAVVGQTSGRAIELFLSPDSPSRRPIFATGVGEFPLMEWRGQIGGVFATNWDDRVQITGNWYLIPD